MLNAKDLARHYRVTERTIRTWARVGRLPAPIRISPCCTRWREQDIELHERRLATASNEQGGN
jgi:hypothetical protein